MDGEGRIEGREWMDGALSRDTGLNTPTAPFEASKAAPQTPPVPSGDYEGIDIPRQVGTWVEQFYQANKVNFDNSKNDRLAILGGENQWDPDVLRVRREKKLPALTINKLPAMQRQVTGAMRSLQAQLQVIPSTTGTNRRTAEVLTGMMRHIQHDSLAKRAFKIGSEHAVQGGEGFWRVQIEDDPDQVFRRVLKIKPVYDQESVFYDPASKEPDFSDAGYVGKYARMRRQDFEREFPGKAIGESDSVLYHRTGMQEPSLVDGVEYVYYFELYWREFENREYVFLDDGESFDVTDLGGANYDEKADRLSEMLLERTIQLATETTGLSPEEILSAISMGEIQPSSVIEWRKVRRPVIKMCLCTKQEYLYGPVVWPGNYYSIIRCSGEEIFIENMRYTKSAIRDAIDPQRIHNYATSQSVATHALAPTAPWLIPEGSIGKFKDIWQNANGGNHQVLPYVWKPGYPTPRRESPPPLDSAALALVAQSSADMREATGIHAASLGMPSNERSGAAIDSRKDQDAIGYSVFVDNYTMALEVTGRVLLDLIPAIYDQHETVMVLGENLRDYALVPLDDEPDENNEVVSLTRGRYTVKTIVGTTYASDRRHLQDLVLEILRSATPEYAALLTPELAELSDVPGADKLAEKMTPIADAIKAKMGIGGPVPPEQAVPAALEFLVQAGVLPPEAAQQIMDATAAALQQRGGPRGEQAEAL